MASATVDQELEIESLDPSLIPDTLRAYEERLEIGVKELQEHQTEALKALDELRESAPDSKRLSCLKDGVERLGVLVPTLVALKNQVEQEGVAFNRRSIESASDAHVLARFANLRNLEDAVKAVREYSDSLNLVSANPQGEDETEEERSSATLDKVNLAMQQLNVADSAASHSSSSGLKDDQKTSELKKTGGEEAKLSPAAQAIADGFDRLLGESGKNDPRRFYGRIPHPPRIIPDD